jgi:hypothetical protein
MKAELLSIFAVVLLSTSSVAFGQTDGEKAARFADHAMRLREDILFKVNPTGDRSKITTAGEKYSWHNAIVTTVFWIGESPGGNNPVPNRASAWDLNWSTNYGGTDTPANQNRRGFIPASFVPRQNPFYIALPYNDVSGGRTKPEAARIIPWYSQAFSRSGQTILKDRWIAIRNGNRVCFAQWEDVGPFSTDHWQYVFGQDRPRSNLNRGAGLDVSPAVRDYLKLAATDVTDWKFVEQTEVQPGPWTMYGDNNTFVVERRKREAAVARNR